MCTLILQPRDESEEGLSQSERAQIQPWMLAREEDSLIALINLVYEPAELRCTLGARKWHVLFKEHVTVMTQVHIWLE